MKHICKRSLWWALGLLGAFGLWTVALGLVDVQKIGPNGSAVGFATVNGAFHAMTGVHWKLYECTDRLGLLPLAVVAGFGVLGLVRWIKAGSLKGVDRDLLVLGGFYGAVLGAFALFEKLAVNYRPVLIGGVLEASYPSSTTMLALCVMATAVLQFRSRIKAPKVCKAVCFLATVFGGFMVVGRAVSGVHWLSDIIGGILLSGGLVLLYHALTRDMEKGKERQG